MFPSVPVSENTSAAALTAAALPYGALAQAVAELLCDDAVQVPPRQVLALHGGGSLFVMAAHDQRVAMSKLITFTPGNAARGQPSIQGDVLVFDVATGRRVALLDGPTVTARRTAAVSLLAVQRLAPQPGGRLLLVGAGVQGLAHLEALAAGWALTDVWVVSRSSASAQALVERAHALGLPARVVADADAALPHCQLVVTCTPASQVVLRALPGPGQMVVAVGAFTPAMVELEAGLCQHVARTGTVVVDTADASHEAGDLLQAGLDVAALPTLAQVVRVARSAPSAQAIPQAGPVLFKSCGWAGWDLAAARLAMHEKK